MEVRFSWPQISLLLKDGGQHGAASHSRSLARLGMQTLHAEPVHRACVSPRFVANRFWPL